MYAPSPYMTPQGPQAGTPSWVIAAGVVAIIALAAYVLKVGPFAPSVVPGALGGVAASGTPTGTNGKPVNPTSVQIGTSPQLDAKKVASIVFTKNTTNATNPGDNDDWRTFQIGEVKVYDTNNRLLSAADFSSAAYNAEAADGLGVAFPAANVIDGDANSFSHTNGQAAVHQLTLVLKNPTDVSHVQVLNRADCCQSRLAGTVCELKAANGALVKSFALSTDQVQDLVVA